MGLINPDVFVFNNGVEKANTYVSFANETLYVRQGQVYTGMNGMPGGPAMPIGLLAMPGTMAIGAGDRLYQVNANYSIYWDKQARFAGKPYIQQGYATTTFEDPGPVNIYEILYDVLKKTVFPNAFDSVANDPNAIRAPAAGPVEEETQPATEEPAEETPAAAPVEETPAAAPAEEETQPAAEEPAEETPAEEETQPVAEEPAEETPAVPAEETQPATEEPTEETPAAAPVEETPAEETQPATEEPAEETPAAAPAEETPAEETQPATEEPTEETQPDPAV